MMWLLALAAALPYPTPPTTTEPSDVPAGECVVAGINIPTADQTPTLIVRCGISSDVDRLFELPLSEADMWLFAQLLESVDDSDTGDEITVHG